jgi:hypothetical protein
MTQNFQGMSNPRRVAELLQSGQAPSDRSFDCWLPFEQRKVSHTYWTPLSVCTRASQWLHRLGVRSVVDIGAGAGKFCVATALMCDCEFLGLEQRPQLVEVAGELARRFGVDHRVHFVEAKFGRDPLPKAEAYYIFNPFRENLEAPERWLDDSVPLHRARYLHEIARMVEFLDAAPSGTIIIEYGGFGGRMPEGYEVQYVDREQACLLRCWKKTAGSALPERKSE